MSAPSWIRLTAWPWLARQRIRLPGGLLLAMAAIAAWPLTVVAGPAYVVAWRRGWPAARLGRQAGWALPMTVVWIAAESARGWRAMTLDPVRDGASGWPHLTAMSVVRTFLLVAPVTIPTGLALAALVWAWRIHTVTTGAPGRPDSLPRLAAAPALVPAARVPVVLPAPRPPGRLRPSGQRGERCG